MQHSIMKTKDNEGQEDQILLNFEDNDGAFDTVILENEEAKVLVQHLNRAIAHKFTDESYNPDFQLTTWDLAPKQKFCGITRDEMWAKYHNNSVNHTTKEFAEECEQVYNLDQNPRFSKVYQKAWADGHSSGFYEVLINLEELLELIK